MSKQSSAFVAAILDILRETTDEHALPPWSFASNVTGIPRIISVDQLVARFGEMTSAQARAVQEELIERWNAAIEEANAGDDE